MKDEHAQFEKAFGSWKNIHFLAQDSSAVSQTLSCPEVHF